MQVNPLFFGAAKQKRNGLPFLRTSGAHGSAKFPGKNVETGVVLIVIAQCVELRRSMRNDLGRERFVFLASDKSAPVDLRML